MWAIFPEVSQCLILNCCSQLRHHFTSHFGAYFIFLSEIYNSTSAMANPRPAGRMRPLKLTNAALLQTLKIAILEQNRLEFQKKSKFWPSKWRFFKNMALEPIWVGHGWSMLKRFFKFRKH
jgi:hypothetical protein